MKKILLVFAMFLFTVTNANATTSYTRYNNIGTPISRAKIYNEQAQVYKYDRYTYRRQPALPARPARIRPIIPAMPYGYRPRYIYLTPIATEQTVQSASTQPMSRLDKNFNAVLPKKSYTMNGVTYYN